MTPDQAMALNAAAAAGGNLVGFFAETKAAKKNRQLAREQNHANIQWQQRMNERNWELAEFNTIRNRQWALDDWHMNNAYNSPEQQMQRYREAGLNPHLMYGNVANSPAAMVRSHQTDVRSGAAPKLDNTAMMHANNMEASAVRSAVGNTLNAFIAIQQLKNETELKSSQAAKNFADINLKNFDFDLKTKYKDLIGKMMEDQAWKLKHEALFAEQTNRNMPSEQEAREQRRLQRENLSQSTERLKELIKLAQQQGKLNQSELDMIEMLSASPDGVKYAVSILNTILGGVTPRMFKSKK